MHGIKIKVSVGTLGVLGLEDVPMETVPTTAYLMLGGRCAMNCAFCAQARDSESSALHLSRVTWPEFDLKPVIDSLKTSVEKGEIKRACIQVTVGKDSFDQTLRAVQLIKEAIPRLPVNVAILPHNLDQVEGLLQAGVDHIGLGLDAANRSVFEQIKGNHWERMWSLIGEMSKRYPGRASVHVIVGLGEKERDVIEIIQRISDLGMTVGLFAFTPLRGTPMKEIPQPALGQYRRVQAARHLICEKGVRMDDFNFSASGRLLNFGTHDADDLLEEGAAFRTSGCPDCNRPFYNERPGGVLFNYPRPLTPEEARAAIAQMELECPTYQSVADESLERN